MAQFLGAPLQTFADTEDAELPIEILHWAPTMRRHASTLVTSGMSARAMTVPRGREAFAHCELMITLPHDWQLHDASLDEATWAWPLEWLRKLARFPHERSTWFPFGQVVPNGDPPRPLDAKKTELAGFILLPPVSLPRPSYLLEDDHGPSVIFWALYPLYPGEIAFALKNGDEAVMEKLEKAGLSDLVQLGRPSFV